MSNMLKIKDIETKYGETNNIVLYCRDVEQQETKTKKQYLIFHLTDGEKDIDAKRWDYTLDELKNAAHPCEIPGVMVIKLETKEYNGQPTYIVQGFRGDNRYPVSMFAKKAPIDPEEVFQKIVSEAKNYREPYASIVTTLYMDNHDKLVKWGAAKYVHHNMYGGLLYHTIRMHEMAKQTADLYHVDKDLLLAGVDLHDIGKLNELLTNDLGVSEFTVQGSLMGHIVLGTKMIEEQVNKLGFEHTPDVLKLEHMILSHHGKLEWGSPVLPMFLEANILHLLDMIDSQGEQIERATEAAQPGVTRPYGGSMKNNFLYKSE